MSNEDSLHDKQQRRERDDKYWAALSKGDHKMAIYYLSPGLYNTFLHIDILTPEERKELEKQAMSMHIDLLVMLSDAAFLRLKNPSRYEASINLALWTLQKWYRFGEFRDASFYTSYDQGEVNLDVQQVALVRAILVEPALDDMSKINFAQSVSRIKPSSPMGWGECLSILERTKPYNCNFQPGLEIWYNDMRTWYLHKSLGGFR